MKTKKEAQIWKRIGKLQEEEKSLRKEWALLQGFEMHGNNSGCGENCPVCGEDFTPEIPWDIWVKGSAISICYTCAEKYVPDLLKEVKYRNKEFWSKEPVSA